MVAGRFSGHQVPGSMGWGGCSKPSITWSTICRHLEQQGATILGYKVQSVSITQAQAERLDLDLVLGRLIQYRGLE